MSQVAVFSSRILNMNCSPSQTSHQAKNPKTKGETFDSHQGRHLQFLTLLQTDTDLVEKGDNDPPHC